MTIGGVVIGSVVFGEVYPWLGEFHTSTALGVRTLPEVFGISYEILVLLLVLGAAGAFFGAEKAETLFARLRGVEREAGTWSRTAHAAVATLALVALIATVVRVSAPGAAATDTGVNATRISALDLGRAAAVDPQGYLVADLRGRPACEAVEGGVPGAICYEDLEDSLDMYWEGRPLVVFDEGQARDLPESLSRFRGDVLVLEGGKAAWDALFSKTSKDAAVHAALPAGDRDVAQALHSYFTGTKARPRPRAAPIKIKRKMKKSGGCG